MDKRTTDTILASLKQLTESRKPIDMRIWLEAAFSLNLLLDDETQLLTKMRQEVAQIKLAIMKKQDKRNVSAADLEVEASDEYRFMKDQENKVDQVREFIRIAKKNSEANF